MECQQDFGVMNQHLGDAMSFSIYQLTSKDVPLMEALLTTFGDAFCEPDTYGENRPDGAYLQDLLSSNYFIALTGQ